MTRPPTLYELMGRAAANAPSPPATLSPPADQPTPLVPLPEPCRVCSNTIQWLDAYKRWHCIECEPYVSRRQARRKLFLITESDGQQEKNSWAEMDLETSEEIKISAHQKTDVAKLPFFAGQTSSQPSRPFTLIDEGFAAKLISPDPMISDEAWWKGELSDRTREIDEVKAGKWSKVFPFKSTAAASPPDTPERPAKPGPPRAAPENFPMLRPMG